MVSLTPSSAHINQTRFDELFTENESAIRRYLWTLKVDASAIDDIVQDTAIALWRKFDDFDSSRPFAPWACRFAFLQVLKHRQRLGRDRLVFDDDHLHSVRADWNKDCEASIARQEALQASLKLLCKSDQLLVHCRYGSGETVQNLAQRSSTSAHKLYHSLDRIRETLKRRVDRCMIEAGWGPEEGMAGG